MNRLFLKIFGWFWLTIMLVSAALVIVTMAALPVPTGRPWDPSLESARFVRQGLMRNLRSTVNLYEDEGVEALKSRVNNLPHLREVLIFDSSGREITGASSVPPPAAELVQKMRESRRSELHDPPFIGIRVISSSNNRYDCVTRVETLMRARGQMDFFNRFRVSAYDNLTGEMILSLVSVIILAGILCFILARHLTIPISRLRDATRELTAGNLSARVGAAIGNRNDEVADLARDFDQMAEQIEKLLKSQIRLIRDVSHELRSPLARLNVALELARLSPGKSRAPALDRIEQESQCLNSMIEQLLSLSRMESGTFSSQASYFELGEMLEKIAEDAGYEGKNRNIQVRVISEEEVSFTGHQQILHSALENVVRNAVSYTVKDSTVTVSLEKVQVNDNRYARIEVRDHGEGVPEAELDRIFTPFYRLAASRDRVSGGSGIGLAITERAVKIHEGSVQAANHPDGGLQITILMPLR